MLGDQARYRPCLSCFTHADDVAESRADRLDSGHAAHVESVKEPPSALWRMSGSLVDDLHIGTPDELVAILESRFVPEIEFEMSAVERRVQLAVVLARQLQDRLIAAVAKAGWNVFSARASIIRRLTEPERIFTTPASWGGYPVPLVLVRPTTSAEYPAPDGFGSVIMLNSSTSWRLLGSLSLADPSWFLARRFDTSSVLGG